MKKKLLFAVAIAVAVSLPLAIPVLAFDGITFHVYDDVTKDPWGTTAGQSYRIVVYNSTAGTFLLDTGVLTTPTDPVLNFQCAWGAADCPAGGSTTTPLGAAPLSTDQIDVYIFLTGTSGDPIGTVTKSFKNAPISGVNFTISENTGTGPTAVTLTNATAESPSLWLPVGVAAVVLVLAGAVLLLFRRRRLA